MNLRSLLLLALVPCANLSAEVTLPKILSSHMVIERDLPVHVWGMATPGEAVAVSFRGQTRSTKAGQLSRWSVYLSPGAAGGPFQMTVTGTSEATGGEAAPAQTITLDDVLVGDVWVASGQSNMEFLMKQAETASQDLPNAANSKIRLLMVKKKAIEYPQDDADTEGWMSSTPETAKDFSAVAWYFAPEIEKREHVPVGGDRLHLGRNSGGSVDADGSVGRRRRSSATVCFVGQNDRAPGGRGVASEEQATHD